MIVDVKKSYGLTLVDNSSVLLYLLTLWLSVVLLSMSFPNELVDVCLPTSWCQAFHLEELEVESIDVSLEARAVSERLLAVVERACPVASLSSLRLALLCLRNGDLRCLLVMFHGILGFLRDLILLAL